MTFSATAHFREHISKIVAEGNQLAGWAKRVFHDSHDHVILTILRSLIIPKLEYCSPLWSPVDATHIQLLESVQEKLTRYMKRFRKYDHNLKIYICTSPYHERLRTLGIPSLQRRRERYQIIYLFKIFHSIVPNPGIPEPVYTRRKITAVKERLSKKSPTWVRTIHEQSFFSQAISLWNILPPYLKERAKTKAPKAMTNTYKEALDAYLNKIPDQPGQVEAKENSLVHQIPMYQRQNR